MTWHQALGEEHKLVDVLSRIGVTGGTRQLARVLLERLCSSTSVEMAAAGIADPTRTRLEVVRLGPEGWVEDEVDARSDTPLAEAFHRGLSVTGASFDGIDVAYPLMAEGTAVGAVGIGGDSVGSQEQLRLGEMAALASLAIENSTLRRDARRSITETATVLSSLIESRDTYTESHCVALAEMSVAVGIRLGLGDDSLTRLNLAGHLHDIGKITIPDDVLLKAGPLDDEEFAVMKSHAAVGERVLSRIRHFVDVAPVVGQHHERFDGTGYPKGLHGEGILLEARILSVVDAFDAMTSSRPYRRALPTAVAVDEVRAGHGTQFDPEVADVFLHYLEGEEAQWNRPRQT